MVDEINEPSPGFFVEFKEHGDEYWKRCLTLFRKYNEAADFRDYIKDENYSELRIIKADGEVVWHS